MIPGLPALVITGYSNAVADIPDDVACLPKPFRQSDLGRSLLDLFGSGGNVISFPAKLR